MKNDESPLFYPVDCAWPSAESDKIAKEASEAYNRQIAAGREYVALIASSHWCSHGYWIEFKKNRLSSQDQLVSEYTKPIEAK